MKKKSKRCMTMIQSLLNESRKDENTILMGDFNAKIGTQADNDEAAVGKNEYGLRNNRGDMLVEFAESKGLKIMNSFFQKKASRK
jgi:endonuclease/exonuclease/phosphatase family metal-dependent hydrolase